MKGDKRVRICAIEEDKPQLPARIHFVSQIYLSACKVSDFKVAKMEPLQAGIPISACDDYKRRVWRWPSPRAAIDFPSAEMGRLSTRNFVKNQAKSAVFARCSCQLCDLNIEICNLVAENDACKSINYEPFAF